MKLNKSWLVAAVIFSACGVEQVGTRYVKQENVRAAEGAIFAVNASDSAELNGTRLEVPAGALVADTRITVELGLTSILGVELAAGPSAVFGPAGTTFTTDVMLTLPVRELNATDDIGIVGRAADGTSFEVDASQVALDATRTRASFRIRQLANYQPRRRAACAADSDCSMGLQCVSGHCRPPPNSCSMGTACAAGQACLNGLCVPVPTDGGSTNPNACMADSDCDPMRERCVNRACRAQCVPSNETCNMVDDDCDGLVDEGCNNTPDAGLLCGGFAGASCPTGFACVDDPRDNCDPNMGGADCGGFCVVPPATDAGTTNPGMCRTSADCMGTVCVNGVCQ